MPKWEDLHRATHCWICNAGFGFITRKYQCSNCEKIICSSCSKNKTAYARVCDVCFVPHYTSSMNQEGFIMAGEAIHAVNSIILQSRSKNMAGIGYINQDLHQSREQINSHMLQMHNFHRDKAYIQNAKEFFTIEDFLAIIVHHVMKFNVGNCEEYAQLAFYYLRKKMREGKYRKFELTIVHIENGDHVFLIIGKTFQADSIVCDAWAKKKYQWKDHLSELKDFVAFTPYKARLENFNPNHQKIIPIKYTLKTGERAIMYYDPFKDFVRSDPTFSAHADFDDYMRLRQTLDEI